MEDSTSPSPALPAGLQFVAAPAGFRDPAALVVRMPLGIRSKRKLQAILAEKLKFPGYFGKNWDALEECLRDLSWLSADKPVVIVHEDVPFGSGGENRSLYLEILLSMLEHWHTEGTRRVQAVFPAKLRDQFIPAANSPP